MTSTLLLFNTALGVFIEVSSERCTSGLVAGSYDAGEHA